VDTDPKVRFTLKKISENEWYIRANQGHSGQIASVLDDSKMLKKIESAADAPICIHGTSKFFVFFFDKVTNLKTNINKKISKLGKLSR
jgi:RNA:NAD 2'-phosphotransferase (TPT1/KptA family)